MQRTIAIIGARGRMGMWFVKYFLSNREQVRVFDSREGRYPEDPNLTATNGVEECVSNADYVFVCTPTGQAPTQIKEAGKEMKAGAVLVEISSVKKDVFKSLRRVRASLIPVSLHPMFGPNASSVAPRLLIIPVRDKDRETRAILQLFNDASISILPNAAFHDKSMGLILGLTYFMNLALAETVSGTDVRDLKKLAGSTFSVQWLVTESVLGEDPALIDTLLSQNPETLLWVAKYIASCTDISRSLRKGSLPEKAQRLSDVLRRSGDLKKANENLYRIISLARDSD